MINNVIVFSGDIALKNEKPLKYSDKISSFPKNEPKNTPKIALICYRNPDIVNGSAITVLHTASSFLFFLETPDDF